MRRYLSRIVPFLRSFRTQRRAALLFALRAAAASSCALWIAIRLGLENPQWAAVTVWIVAQPSRGMTISKGFYRFLGTSIGALVAIVMILLFGRSPWTFIFILSIWMAICSMIATSVLYFQSYAAVLAGFTASIVGLLVFSHTEFVYEVALSRIACVFLGIFVATAFSSLLARSETKKELLTRIRMSVAQSLEWLALICARAPRSEKMQLERFLVSEASAIEEQTAYAAAESMQIRMRLARAHNVIASLLSILSAARAFDALIEKRADLASALLPSLEKTRSLALEIAGEIRRSQKFSDDAFLSLRRSLSDVTLLLTGEATHQELLVERIEELTRGIESIVNETRALAKESAKSADSVHLSHHRDWKMARLAGLRAALGVLFAGAIWQFTGWHVGPFLVMMAAVNCAIFATKSDPVAALVTTLKATAVAYVAAPVTAWLFLSSKSGLAAILIAQLPFLIPGGILMTNPATALAGTLFSANYQVFLSPNHPLIFDWSHYLDLGYGVFGGTALSWAIFRFLIPAHPRQHVKALRVKIVGDLERLVRNESKTVARQWETRTYHRISRLITASSEAGDENTGFVEAGLAALQVGRDVLLLRAQLKLVNDERHTETTSIVGKALHHIETLSSHPVAAVQELRKCAAQMRALPQQSRRDRLSILLEEIADQVEAHASFFAVS